MNDHSWRDDAACAGEDTDRFFSDNQTDIKWALDMCASCPVKAACLKDAVDNEERSGIRGGTTATARGRLITANNRRTA